MHTRHTFGVADDELRGYMVTSPFVVPHFLVDKSPTMCANNWNPKCWFEVSRVQLWCIPLCVCNYSLKCHVLSNWIQMSCNHNLLISPPIVLPVPKRFCTVTGKKQTSVTCCPSPVKPTLMHVYSFITSVSTEAEFTILLQHSCTLFTIQLSLS